VSLHLVNRSEILSGCGVIVLVLLFAGMVQLSGRSLPKRDAFLVASQAAPALVAVDTLEAIVVGGGIAGLSAAYELGKGGARVRVVDMASVFGGHAVMATGDLCIVDTPFQEQRGIQDSVEIAYRDFMTWGEDPNPQWVRYYVEHSREEIYDWVTSLGVTFETLVLPAGNSVERTHRTAGRGISLVTPIFSDCAQRPNISFSWNTQVERLLRKGDRIDGVLVTDTRSGASAELHALVVVLATGGFQSNLDMVRESWATALPFPERFLIGSGIHSLGTGHKIAATAGAKLEHLDRQWNYITGLPDPRHPEGNRGLHAVNPDSAWVDARGQRFIAERSSTKLGFPLLVRLPGSTYWSIFDEASKRSFWVAGSEWSSFEAIERHIFANPKLVKIADTLHELATLSGLPATQLQDTIAHWNEMVDKGVDEDFGRFGPGKTYKPKKIAQPPFYAIQFYPLTRKSMGGVAIDDRGRVLDTEGKVIAGLYAAGELTGVGGINGKAALEGTFLGPSMVTGRVAGRTALSEIGVKVAPARRDMPLQKPLIEQNTTALCTSCHALSSLVEKQRAGYWHFESVHRLVLHKGLDCMQCHSELGPVYEPARHKLDRLMMVRACPVCHSGEDH